jgi:hypothetical protein
MKTISLYLWLAAAIGFMCLHDQQPLSSSSTLPRLYKALHRPEPIEILPKHVVSEEGELTLFSDYDGVSSYDYYDTRYQYAVLYLINRTNRNIGFLHQGGDPYTKLEALNEAGKWERAEGHIFSGCGNSYFGMPVLRPGQFFQFLGIPHQSVSRPRFDIEFAMTMPSF